MFAVFWWRLGLFIVFFCLHILSRRPPPALDRRNRNTIRKVDSRDKQIQKRKSMNVLVFEFWVGGDKVWFFFFPVFVIYQKARRLRWDRGRTTSKAFLCLN